MFTLKVLKAPNLARQGAGSRQRHQHSIYLGRRGRLSKSNSVANAMVFFPPSISKGSDGHSHFWVRTCILLLSCDTMRFASVTQFLHDNDVLSLFLYTDVESRSKR